MANINKPTLKRATDIISMFRARYSTDVKALDFYTSQYLAGDGNKELRRAVIFCITNEVKPLSKCGLFHVSDCLKGAILQSQLF